MRLFLILFLFSTTSVFGQSKITLAAEPMLGFVEMTEANIWIQTTEPTYVVINAKADSVDAPWFNSGNVRTFSDKFNIAHIKIDGLQHGTRYEYEVVVDGENNGKTYSFSTQKLWQWRTDPPKFSVMMGSCIFVNDPPNDRPGRGYGGEFEVINIMSKQDVDMMLWLGDNVYYREPDFFSKAGLAYRNNATRQLPDLQSIFSNYINIATWDDHDFGPNDADRTYRLREEALELFKLYWMNPSYGTAETDGIFGRYMYNDVEFFLLDDRYHRAPNKLQDDDKPYLGDAQLQWLKESLVSSNASFKIIVNGNQVINTNNQHEAWAKYPTEFNNFMDWLLISEVDGVMFLSGDRHHTELLKVQHDGFYPLYEFTSSPITSGTHNRMGSEEENPLRVDGTLVNDKRNFGIMTVEGPRNKRMMTLKTIDSEGVERWKFTINQEDLRTKK